MCDGAGLARFISYALSALSHLRCCFLIAAHLCLSFSLDFGFLPLLCFLSFARFFSKTRAFLCLFICYALRLKFLGFSQAFSISLSLT
mgnify:CR=1 FL=1